MHDTIGAFICSLHDKSLDKTPSAIVIIGNEGIGKTSIVLEEAKEYSEYPTKPINLEHKASPDNFAYYEFDNFYLLTLEYSDKETCLYFQKPLVDQFITQRAIPIYSTPENQKSIIIEINCSKDDANDIAEIFSPFEVYYYKLTKEDFIAWTREINPATGLANLDKMCLETALAHLQEY